VPDSPECLGSGWRIWLASDAAMGETDAAGFRERVPPDALPPRTGIQALSPAPSGLAHLARRATRTVRQTLQRQDGHDRRRSVSATGDRVLVAGWFSWSGRGATAGDVHACEVVCHWLSHANRAYDIASVLASLPGVDWRRVDPAAYSDVVFVCGPVGPQAAPTPLLARFAGSRHIGIDLTMLEPVASWNPFDVLVERDSDRASRPDLSFAAPSRALPVIGVVLVEPYDSEYRARDMQPAARAAVARLINSRDAAIVEIDTRLERNNTGLRTADEVASLVARMDAVVTTRLHGLVFAIKAGVPALVIDPVAGGAKIRRQAEAIGWPYVHVADELSDTDLNIALDACLTQDARLLAQACAARAANEIDRIRSRFLATMTLISTEDR
jgi:Polysaccharide pyruvyl transferase